MLRVVIRGWVLLLAVLAQSLAVAWAVENRVALLIGNSAYRHTAELKNPKNDVADMAAALGKLKFKIIAGYDLDRAGTDRIIKEFAAALKGASVGVFFYAGHGLQVAGRNYLVPIDAQLASEAALDFEMVGLDVVQRTMERQAATNVLFLDACRDNPLARNLARAMGTRSAQIGRGLAGVESGVGTLISFSTQPGSVALDGSGRNSPFAGALAKRLAASNDDLSAILIDVRNDVMRETQNRQVPWEHSALRARLYLSPAQASGASQTKPPATNAPGPDQTAKVAENEPVPAPSAAISTKAASKDAKAPVAVAAGEVVRGRLAARDKFHHFWAVEAPAGKYRVVLDMKLANDASSNIQGGITALRADGGQLGQVFSINEIDFRTRSAGEIDATAERGIVLRVGNWGSNIVDYWLGVFPIESDVPSPYFVRAPRVVPLEFGRPYSATLEPKPGEPAEAWYSASLQGQDYRITAEFVRLDGARSNVQGAVEMFGPIGERRGNVNNPVCRVNEIDTSGRCDEKLVLAEDTKVLFRLMPSNKAGYRTVFTVEPIN